MKPVLKFFASLWTLRGYPTPANEWTMAEKFAEVKRQGFAGVGGRYFPEVSALCLEHGLEYILYIDANAANFEAQLRVAPACRPQRINVQLCEHDTPPAEAAAVWLALEVLAAELGLAVDLELHRDTATETPEKTREIAVCFRAATGRSLRFSLDFSHFAVAKYLAAPFSPCLLADAGLLDTARQLHLRPFNGHHAQIPATDGHGSLTAEARDYLAFVEDLFSLVLKTAAPGDVFHAGPENGPVVDGYALACFPDGWLDAVRIRDEARRLWQDRGGAC